MGKFEVIRRKPPRAVGGGDRVNLKRSRWTTIKRNSVQKTVRTISIAWAQGNGEWILKTLTREAVAPGWTWAPYLRIHEHEASGPSVVATLAVLTNFKSLSLSAGSISIQSMERHSKRINVHYHQPFLSVRKISESSFTELLRPDCLEIDWIDTPDRIFDMMIHIRNGPSVTDLSCTFCQSAQSFHLSGCHSDNMYKNIIRGPAKIKNFLHTGVRKFYGVWKCWTTWDPAGKCAKIKLSTGNKLRGRKKPGG